MIPDPMAESFMHESVNAAGLIVTALYREGWIDVHEWQRITKVLMAAGKRRAPPFPRANA